MSVTFCSSLAQPCKLRGVVEMTKTTHHVLLRLPLATVIGTC